MGKGILKSLAVKLLLAANLLAMGLSLTGCSFSSIFIVTNESKDRLQIRYVLKKPEDAPSTFRPYLTVAPGVMLISELDDGNVRWREPSPSTFTFNEETATVVATLMPNEALRVDQMRNTRCSEAVQHADDFRSRRSTSPVLPERFGSQANRHSRPLSLVPNRNAFSPIDKRLVVMQFETSLHYYAEGVG